MYLNNGLYRPNRNRRSTYSDSAPKENSNQAARSIDSRSGGDAHTGRDVEFRLRPELTDENFIAEVFPNSRLPTDIPTTHGHSQVNVSTRP